MKNIDKKLLIKKFESLSKRERSILNHIIDGKKSKEIAEIQHVSGKTIATYMIRIKSKTGINSLNLICFLIGKYQLL